jgi:hypothetical protein
LLFLGRSNPYERFNEHEGGLDMKRGLFVLLISLAFSGAMILPVQADQWDHNKGHKKAVQQQGHKSKAQPVAEQTRRGSHYGTKDHRGDRDRYRGHEYRSPNHHPRGYSMHARKRYYERSHVWKNRHYRYDGHWNSWSQWNAYRLRYPEKFRAGGYYRENGHLFFRFFDPLSGGYLFFSIGR